MTGIPPTSDAYGEALDSWVYILMREFKGDFEPWLRWRLDQACERARKRLAEEQGVTTIDTSGFQEPREGGED